MWCGQSGHLDCLQGPLCNRETARNPVSSSLEMG